VEMCLRIGHADRRVMYTPWARLVYQEGAKLERLGRDEDLRRAYDHFADVIAKGDPYYNSNLSRSDLIPCLGPVR
jgi:hypothetical protein